LWFITSVSVAAGAVLAIGAGVPALVPDMFCFGCPTDGTSLNSSSSSLLPVSLVSDSVSCISCSLDSSWYSDCSSLM